MKPHEHAELIKAWADGHTIEMFTADGCWMEVPHPSWLSGMEYRIKKEPKPDIVQEEYLYWNMAVPVTANLKDGNWSRWLRNGDAYTVAGTFKLTYDGETRELKAAELIK
jgi:hypothetical protein